MFTIMFTLILAEWQARAVESLITYNYTCTWTLGPVSGIRIRFYNENINISITEIQMSISKITK